MTEIDRNDELRELWEQDEQREQARQDGNVYPFPDQEPPPDPDPGPAEYQGTSDVPDQDDPNSYEALVVSQMRLMRIRREAKQRLDDEERPPPALPPVKNLDTLLAEPDSSVRYRIDQLAPAEGRIMLSAQYKSGKTVLVDNLVRALADGDEFLGRFMVQPARRIVVIDDELSENTLRRWLRDQAIANTAAVADVVSLRGRLGAFNILDDRCRNQWATRLSELGCDYLVLDCLRPILDALGLDESREAGRFLVAFDTLLADAGTDDAALVHHMGHQNERARGDSRLQDWPDAIWKLNREDPNDPTSVRYFSAVGRDVSVPEGRLSYDPATRRLTYAAGSRTDARGEAARVAVIRLLASAKGSVKSGDIDALDYPRKVVREARDWLRGKGVLSVDTGDRNAQLYRIAYPCSECGLPVAARLDRHLSCDPSRVELPND